ncbi:hypothetical protein [Acinetobacter ursingii]|uniref:hypothetical protein n=1 Tax=Acinetobacter ursingii TaxID=108980 RepID=UPI00124E4C6E|nr:hypothetical protein [Acinetobacter ursingii]
MPDINTEIDSEGNELLNEFEYSEEELAEIKALEEQDKLNQIDASGKPIHQTQDDDLDDDFLNDLTKGQDGENNNPAPKPDPEPTPEQEPKAAPTGTPPEPAPKQEHEPTLENNIPEVEDYTEQLTELTQQKEDAQGKIDDVLEQLEKLGEDFDNGEIGQGKYEAQKLRLQRDLNQYETQLTQIEQQHTNLANTSAEQNLSRQEALNQAWARDAKSFIDQPENELLKNNPNMAHAFDQTLTALGQAGQLEGLSNTQVLQTVRAALAIRHPELNTKPTGQQQEQKKKPTHDGFVPPVSLANVPSTDGLDDNPFAHIDKLSGIEYETAISKMTPAQRAAYYGSDFYED